MANELKPCPFCGNDPSLSHMGSGCYTVSCSNGHHINTKASKEKAITAWNTRPAAPVEELETVLHEIVETLPSGTVRWQCAEHAFQAGMIASATEYGSVVNALVTRSQAEAIVAAERAAHKRTDELLISAVNDCHTKDCQINALQQALAAEIADNAALTARVKELEAENSALEKQALRDRNLANETHSDATLWQFSVDMGDHPSLLVKVWKQRKALETKLAAAQKELRRIKPTEATSYVLTETLMAAAMRFATNITGPMTVDKLFGLHVELNKSAMLDSEPVEARAALEGKP